MINLETKEKIDSVLIFSGEQESNEIPAHLIIFKNSKVVACFETESFQFENINKVLEKYKVQTKDFYEANHLCEYWNCNEEGIEVSYK
ncbi:hypothetical protein [Leptospira phage LE3]|uniref:Uncharacterized protein n=1 Tax=Leptospira phage LE3 TaxID=2041382 RepID=A0A343LE31_9CAUD|nr:hypothetical protein HWB33_gp53 [Leptospira phage LE3]ATN94941.1 hypothetical protein [Leptospira phage LE3]